MAHYPTELAALIHARVAKFKPPEVNVLARLVEVLYFASLKTEESHYIRCWVAYVNPDDPDPNRPMRIRPDRWTITKLRRRIPFTERNLAKIAPAADPWSTAIAVFADRGRLFIWGMIDQGIHKSRIMVREPTLGGGYEFAGIFQIVIHGPAELAAYRDDELIGRLRQDSLVRREYDVLWKGPVYKKLRPAFANLDRRIRRTVGKEFYDRAMIAGDAAEEEWLSSLSRILIAIQRYRHGGAVLISKPSRHLRFKFELPYSRVADLIFHLAAHSVVSSASQQIIVDDYFEPERKRLPMDLYRVSELAEAGERDFSAALTGAVHFLGSLSRVDGLIHFLPDLRCSGFGAEIRIDTDPERVCLATASDPKPDELSPLDPAHFGMRHRSMMRFCARHRDSVGFVISQDGDIRAMTLVGKDLVIWENVMVFYSHREYWSRIEGAKGHNLSNSVQSTKAAKLNSK